MNHCGHPWPTETVIPNYPIHLWLHYISSLLLHVYSTQCNNIVPLTLNTTAHHTYSVKLVWTIYDEITFDYFVFPFLTDMVHYYPNIMFVYTHIPNQWISILMWVITFQLSFDQIKFNYFVTGYSLVWHILKQLFNSWVLVNSSG